MSTSVSSFHKSSLAVHVANALRDGIVAGEIQNPLPGEYQLAEHLGVSRPVLREALSILAKEGVLEIVKGRRTRIIDPANGRVEKSAPRLICAIGCPTQRVNNVAGNTLIQNIHLRMAEEGILWEELFDPKLSEVNAERYLKKWTSARRHAVWVLIMAPRPVQTFFSKAGLPALIIGSNFEGIRLPAIDWDYEAVGRHAANTMIRHGHRKIALLLPRVLMAGDLATLKGIEQVTSAKSNTVTLSKTSISPSSPELETDCARLLKKAGRPDAVFAFRSTYAIALLTKALSEGVPVPGGLHLLCRDDHPVFDVVFPRMDRYAISETRFLHGALRLIHALLDGQSIEQRPHFIMPERIRGETISSPKTS